MKTILWVLTNLCRNNKVSQSFALTISGKGRIPLRTLAVAWTWTLLYCSHVRPFHVSKIVRHISKWYKCNGVSATIDFVKDCRLLITRWICDEPLIGSPNIRVKTDKSGWPTQFAWIKPDKGNMQAYREILSLINILRSVQGVKPLNTDDITDAPKSTGLGIIQHEIDPICKKFTRENPVFSKFHLSTKRGPNGHAMSSIWLDYPAAEKQLADLVTLGGELWGKHFTSFGTLIGSVIGPGVRELLKIQTGVGLPTPGKIVGIPAPEGKTRTVAQLGYWHQSALLPLHEDCLRILRSMREDCTYDQGKVWRMLQKGNGDKFHSLDLKAATDRFPIELQTIVLRSIYGVKYSTAWYNIMRSDFSYENKILRWATGQPIGSYSSWAVFALTHHILIRWCFRQLSIPYARQYAVLGDDVVICNDRVASLYTMTLHQMGVDVSKTKTHVSEHSFEFAKRWYREGKGEFSPFQFSSLVAVGPRSSQVCEYLLDVIERGWRSRASVPQTTALFVSAIAARTNWNHFVKSVRLAASCWYVITYLRGYIPGVSIIRNLQRINGLPELPASMSTTHYCGDGIINNVVVEMFTDSVDTDGERELKYRLNIESQLACHSAGPSENLQETLNCIPHLSVEKQLQEQAESIMARAWTFDAFYSGCWDLTMRSLSAPDPETVFSQRSNEIRQLYVSRIVRMIIERVKLIASIGI